MSNDMTNEQFETLRSEIADVRKSQITKSDVFQAVLTVQAFFAATIVGCVVVLNALGAFS